MEYFAVENNTMVQFPLNTSPMSFSFIDLTSINFFIVATTRPDILSAKDEKRFASRSYYHRTACTRTHCYRYFNVSIKRFSIESEQTYLYTILIDCVDRH